MVDSLLVVALLLCVGFVFAPLFCDIVPFFGFAAVLLERSDLVALLWL